MKKLIHAKRKHLIIFIVLAALLFWVEGKIIAADYTWGAGDHAGGSFSGTNTITITGNVALTSQIKITSGTTTIKLPDNATASRSIKRKNSSFSAGVAMIRVDNGAKLIIKGTNSYKLIIDGGSVYTDNDAYNSLTTTGTQGALIRVIGNAELSNVTLRNAYNNSNDNNDGAGAIQCGSENYASKTLKLTDVTITACRSPRGAAVLFWDDDNHTCTFTGVTIQKCYSTETNDKSGVVRTYGGVKTKLTLDNCTIKNNHSNKRGGGFYWNAGGSADAILTLKGGTKVQNNVAVTDGGGIFATGQVVLEEATISGNQAANGAGIYMDTYDGGISDYNGQAFDFTMGNNVTISNNTATTMGGGVMLRIRASKDVGYTSSNAAVDVTFTFDMSGGTITGNKAPQGAGVAIDDDAPQKVKYAFGDSNKTSGTYNRDVKIRGGSIDNNTTTGTRDFSGGGVYIYKHITASNNASTNFGNIPIAISGGAIYDNKATLASGTGSVTNGSGGGVYILNSVTSGYTSTCSVTVSGSAQIYGNSCTYAGGGIYLNGGTFTMTGGHVGQNSSGTASANRAANGAGFYIDGGSCTIQGGNIVNNVATGNGGGFYVDPGSSVTTNINSNSNTTTTKVNSNQAVNGGGAFIATGTLSVSGANTQINSNRATTSGGGLYVNGGTVSVNSATIGSNTAATHGGGIYSSSGAVTLTSAKLTSNTATSGNGGGVYAGSNVTVTSSTLTGNIATNGANGKGGGIYATGTNTTVSITGTSTAKSLFTTNQARWGGAICAEAKSVTVTQATIGNSGARNTATQYGGGIYAAGPVTLNTGTVIQCNTATTSGGGVYVNNATFTQNAGTIGGTSATYANIATSGNGGGIYITGSNAKVEIKGGTISYNSAPATATGNGNGGGIYVASTGTDGTAISGGATVSNNTAKNNGGGVYVVSGKVSLVGTSTSVLPSISNNTATSANGGGVYLGGGEFILGNYSTIVGNHANNGDGGGVYVTGTSPIYRQNGNTYTEVKQNSAKNGAGIFMGAGNCYISQGYIHDNDATANGGGIYVNGGTVTHSGGEIGKLSSAPNTAVNGAGLYMNGGTYTSTGGYFNGNTASGKGGGIYMNGGKCYFQGGMLGFNTSTMRNTAAYGGGLYMASSAKAAPEFYMSTASSSIRGNHATNDGGAIYMEGGTCEITAGNIGESNAANSAVNGGGIYANGGTITVKGGYLQYNQASENGGGIYANDGTVEVNYTDATTSGIRYNYATLAGGGLYIALNGTLYLKGKATLTKNHVPLGSLGGGVYLAGTVQAGSSSSDIITVVDNYAANENNPASYTPVAATRNNIYLPAPVDTQTTDVITIVTNGLDLTHSKVGFSVPGNFLPVIYCSSNTYLNDNQTAIINAVFEDSERYGARYFPSSSTYSPKYIYLAADTWVQQVTEQPAGYSESGTSVTISSERGLAWLISKVNGLNGQTETNQDDYSGKTITLTKDLDMSDYAWVPIGMTGGTSPKAFKGNFDGGGHLVSGILCSYLGNGDTGTGQNLGLFGVVDGAVIHDVFLEESSLSVVDNSVSTTINLGGLASSGSATIYNCTASATMNSNNANTVMGGLIGQMTGGAIHSSAAMPIMTGYTMGGLVGTMATGTTLYNSFANPKFTHVGSGTEFVGGLVAENSGTIQNCYVRFTQPSTLGSAKFGQLVGTTSNANVTICYHPTTYSTGISSNLVYPDSGSVSSIKYGDAIAPYLYNRAGDMTLSNDATKNLLDELNRWVTGHSGYGYASWKRTTAGDYTAEGGDINGDYPIHLLTGYTCAASTNGVNLDYATSLDVMLTRHTSDVTINLYANENNVTKSTGNNEVVYIDENVSLLQGNTTSRITAYTGQTLRNYSSNANRWHNVSSSLKQSGIGFDYYNNGQGQDADFNWDINPCNIALSGDNDNAFFPSDMPWPATAQMDFYCFYEPEYHWINLKRNTDSHWHMNATTVPIVYNGNGIGAGTNGNETYMVPGKGYLVSIDKDQLIQNKGELNNGTVTLYSVTKTDANEWAGLLGYNLLGNPYQSYLDFEAFMSQNLSDDAEHPVTNAGNLWVGGEDDNYANTYATFDPEQNAYRQYFGGTSNGATVASRYIHPHQGFFVRMTKDNANTNTNTNTTTVTYTNDMRTNTTDGQSGFRDAGQPSHALVNFVVRDTQGKGDIAVLELNRDGDEGAEKIRMGDGTGHLSLGYDGKAYAILFRTKVDGYQPLWFEATEAGTFTLGWDIHNAVFESLTLVDNIAGTSTDMLATDSYTFQGSPDHYASRFKVVIGDYVEVDPDAPEEPVEGPTFAFQMGDQLVVNGAGTLQVFDVMGRQLSSTTLSGTRSTVGLPTAATGVYVLRLTNENGTKVQKIVFGN